MTHLSAELARLDILLHREVLRLRAAYRLSLDEFRGLYVSNEQVDDLLRRLSPSEGGADVAALTLGARRKRDEIRPAVGDSLPWSRLVRDFRLSEFEQDVLLMALAPQLDLKYETLYAYLNNDVTRKWPTRDLALRAFSDDPNPSPSNRESLDRRAPLFAQRLLQTIENPHDSPSWLSRGFRIGSSVVKTLLDAHVEPLPQSTDLWDQVAPEARVKLRRLAEMFRSERGQAPPLLILEGRPGSGRRHAAEAVSAHLGRRLLSLDLAAATSPTEPTYDRLAEMTLRQRLDGAVLYLTNLDTLSNGSAADLASAQLIKSLRRAPGPVFLAVSPAATLRDPLRGIRRLTVRFDDPDHLQRCRLWRLAAEGSAVADEVLEALAERFVLTPGQIGEAFQTARDAARLEGGDDSTPDSKTLFAAARLQSNEELGRLAVKVRTIHTWDDLVLPAATLAQLREIAASVGVRHVVFEDWGFQQRIAGGQGIRALFSGGSGTGKTMTAGVIARDLGLDLFKIDLSGVVSKYIGETEKNLDRVFRAAHAANAILFFDEADALFGKRSEVKDAHDRYANIEVAYLLQKMEEHEGVVILASNLSRNIDQAFSRRMQYVVDFPFPDKKLRLALWRGMFPPRTPLADDVDLEFLAANFRLAGGDITNVALEAAFLAAQQRAELGMRHLIKSIGRQMQKQGKTVSAVEFKQYFGLLG